MVAVGFFPSRRDFMTVAVGFFPSRRDFMTVAVGFNPRTPRHPILRVAVRRLMGMFGTSQRTNYSTGFFL